jgi:hypothetical protein
MPGKKGRKEAYVGILEANREKSGAVAEQQDIPKEETAVETIGALKDQYMDRHLSVRRRRQYSKQTQGHGESRQKLAAARIRMARRAVPAPRKGHGHQGPGKDSVAKGTPKGGTFGKRRRARPECNNGIRKRDLNQQLRLGSKGNINETFRQTLSLEIVKRTVESSVRIRKMSDWTLWRSWPSPKRKKRLLADSELGM